MSTTSGPSRMGKAPRLRRTQSQLSRARNEPDRRGQDIFAPYGAATAEPTSATQRARSTMLTPLALGEPVVWPPVQQQVPQYRLYDVISNISIAILIGMLAFTIFPTSMDTLTSIGSFKPLNNVLSTYSTTRDPQGVGSHGTGPLVALKATRADVLAMLYDQPRFIDDLAHEAENQRKSVEAFFEALKNRPCCKAEDVISRLSAYRDHLDILLGDMQKYIAAHREAAENVFVRDNLGRRRLGWHPELNGQNLELLDKEAVYTRSANTLLAAVRNIDTWLSGFQASWELVNQERKALRSSIIEKRKVYDRQIEETQPRFFWQRNTLNPEYAHWVNASRCQATFKKSAPQLRFSAEPDATDLQLLNRHKRTLTRITANLE